MLLLEDPAFIKSGFQLVEFYRQNPELAAHDLLNVDLSDVQKVVLRAMWHKNYVMAIMSRGAGKSFLLAVFCCLKGMLYPGHRIGIIAPTFRQCVVGDTVIVTDQGISYVEDLKSKPDKLLSSKGLQICSDFWTIPPQPTIKITTDYGFQLEGAENHKVLVLNTFGNFEYKNLIHLSYEDALFLNKGKLIFGEKTNLETYIPEYHSIGTTKDCFIPPILDTTLSYFLGLLTGDGGLTSENYVGFTNNDPDIISIYKEISSIYFNNSSPSSLGENGKVTFSKGNIKFYNFLVNLGLGNKYSYEKSFPKILLSSSKENICSYIQGLFDTDGGAYLYPNSSHSYKISMTSTSEKLIREVQIVLLGMGIIGSISKNFNEKNRKRILYQLEISNKDSILLFRDLIGFRCARKQEVLLSIVEYLKQRDESRQHSDTIPNLDKYLKSVCLSIRKLQKGFGHLLLWKYFDKDGNFKSKNGITRNKLKSILSFCEDNFIQNDSLNFLKEIINNNGFFCKISSKEKGFSTTYDFTVKETHDYFSNGFISHNSKNVHAECKNIWQKAPILQNSTTKPPTTVSDHCYLEFKPVAGKSSSYIMALPLGDGQKIRGARFFSIVCDEFPHIPEEIFNMVVRPMAATTSDPMLRVRKLEKQAELLKRGLITQEEIDASSQSTNQIIITSSGYFTFNHMYPLYCAYKNEMLKGNPKYAVFRVPYYLLPKGFLDRDNVEAARREMSSLEFRIEYEADFIPDTDAFYKASLLESCSRSNFSVRVVGSPGKKYCLGIDPARSEDSFAICVAELDKPAKIVYAIELQKQPFPKMASLIEELCRSFNVTHIYMDAGGGGLAIKDILAENHSMDPRGPILDPEDEVHQTKQGRHLLRMCDFTSDFISNANFAALRLLEHKDILFPTVPIDAEPSLEEDEGWKIIQKMKQQMQMIELTETATGKHHFDVPKGGGHEKQKKDLYTSFLLAARCIYDNLWSEYLPESIIHHGGAFVARDTPKDLPISFIGDPALGYSIINIPDVLRDKLEIAQDPQKFKQKILLSESRKRPTLVSASAVLKPIPGKK